MFDENEYTEFTKLTVKAVRMLEQMDADPWVFDEELLELYNFHCRLMDLEESGAIEFENTGA